MANDRNWQSLLDEYKLLRTSTIMLIEGLSEDALKQVGTVNDGVMSARALGFIIIGHEKHHCEVISERYL